jgi:hypothetical protein
MMRRVLILGCLLAYGLVSGTTQAHAQTTSSVSSYVAGWNMVGAPAQTDLSAASYLSTYIAGGYITPSGSRAIACQGYWAYFTNPTNITLQSNGPTTSQTCILQPGWNMVGNPFAGAAQLPDGVRAYYWNPKRDAYDVVTLIPPGGSVWILSGTASNVVLTFVPVATPPPSTVTIEGIAGMGPFNVHVGDSIKIEVPTVTSLEATADPTYLHLETSGISGPLTCVPSGSCAISLVNRFWIYQAIAPGKTFIALNPTCLQVKPACGQPSFAIEIDIAP